MKYLIMLMLVLVFQTGCAETRSVRVDESFFFDRYFYIEDCFVGEFGSSYEPCVPRPAGNKCMNAAHKPRNHLVCGDSIMLRRIPNPSADGYDVVFALRKTGHEHPFAFFGKLTDGEVEDGKISLEFKDDYPSDHSEMKTLTLRAVIFKGRRPQEPGCKRILENNRIPDHEIRDYLCKKNYVIYWHIDSKSPIMSAKSGLEVLTPPGDGQGTGSGDGLGGG